MRACVLLVLALGCGKRLNPEFCEAHPDDTRCLNAPDSMKGDGAIGFDVAHLPPTAEAMLMNTATVNITSFTTINSMMGTVEPGIDALVIPSTDQDSGTPVMVIQAANFTFGEMITVVGDKPVIIVATNDITVNALIEAGARMDLAGAGGGQQTSGQGKGGTGQGGNGNADAGAGGGSYGTSGGNGGDADQRGGAMPGPTYGTATTLQGGSGGGRGAGPGSCLASGGAGGGAIQLTAGRTLTIANVVNAGGGGGDAASCSTSSDGSSGGGGGSGGMIYIQARTFAGTGTLGANGGGGGGGSSPGGTNAGGPGSDATPTGGGVGGFAPSGAGRGGGGAMGTSSGEDGGNATGSNENGGGGGGGTGRIYYQGPQPSYTSSPPPSSA
jgi:hypothetical protein